MQTSIPASTLEKFTTFGDLLRFLRRRLGITQMELALGVGYSDTQISRLEQNLRLPDIPTIEARFVSALQLEDDPRAVARMLDLAANVRREDAPGLGLAPYKGLGYFDEADSDLFVGREALSAKLTERVLGLVGRPPRFLAVVGASGSGKSSLVRAGLVPALRWSKPAADWDIHTLTPTAHPLESLAMSLTQSNGSLAAAARLMDDLASDPRSLHLFATRQARSSNDSRLLIVLDQFEETFALCRPERERSTFIANLLTAVSEPDGPVIVVITLRADFYAHCASYVDLREALAQQQEYIGAMSPPELRRAIEEPARRGRWEFEPGLVDLLLREVGREPGALPLLSHALLETWLRRRGRMMTMSGYASSGGVRGAIAETAETVFTDQFTQEQRSVARRIFLRLTELGDETATGDTRRRAFFNELILRPEEAAITQDVLKTLADARLIITTENSAEVAHEALIREWPTLRGWLEDNRDNLRLHRHLTDSAQEWDGMDREPDLLYRGARLAQAREWAFGHAEELNALEREFLDSSQAQAEHEAIEREIQHQRELEAAQKLAEAERRRAEEQAHASGQLRRRSNYLAVALIVATALLVVAGYLGWQARLAGAVARSRELAAASIGNLDVDPERGILLALDAISASHTLEAEDALHLSVMASHMRMTIPAYEPGPSTSVVYSPDGQQLATASANEIVKVWDANSGTFRFRVGGHAVAFSPDGRLIATVLDDGLVKLWDAQSGQEQPLPGPIDGGGNLSFSPDGTRLATVTPVNLPRIWDVRTARQVASFPGHTDYVSYVFFNRDGTRLLSTSDDGTARVWNAATGAELLKLGDHPTWVWTAAFSPNGNWIATVSNDEIRLWDGQTGQQLLKLSGSGGAILSVAFSPNGSWLASGGGDHNVHIWDVATGRELFTLHGHAGSVSGLAFSPDGGQLASSSEDGTVRVWDLAPGHEALGYESAAGLESPAAFSQDSRLMAAVEGPELKVWNIESAASPLVLSEHGGSVRAAAFSPNARLLFTGSADGKITTWDLLSGRQISVLPAHTAAINAMAMSANGAQLVTAGDDYKLKFWSVSAETGPAPESVMEFPTSVDSVGLSPDGTLVAAGLHNGIVRIVDAAAHKERLSLSAHGDGVTSVSFSPDASQLATASSDGTAKLWDAASGNLLFTMHGHINAVMSITFSPDGLQAATASSDGSARLWDTRTGREVLSFAGNATRLARAAYSADGTRLMVSGGNGMRIYLLRIEELVSLARQRVTRKLTVDECEKYLHRVTSSCAGPVAQHAATPLPLSARGRICQVTNLGGLHDGYFNEMLYKGVQNAAQSNGWEATALESASTPDLMTNMQTLSAADCKLIATLYTLAEETRLAAEANPDKKFVAVDFTLDPPPANVWMQTYATDQAAFLAGYVAASATRTGKVGLFGGVDIPNVTDFMDGFALGVQYYNRRHQTNVEVLGWDVKKHEGLFVGSFCCSTEGRQLAARLMAEGADIILPVAGSSVGWGAAAEIRQHGNARLIGVDTDWAIAKPEFAGITLTSIEKRFDISVEQAARAVADGTYRGGLHVGTLTTGEVAISPFHSLDFLISDQVRAELADITRQISAGKIKTKR